MRMTLNKNISNSWVETKTKEFGCQLSSLSNWGSIKIKLLIIKFF
jgi:hypothetical protein